ncbi:hypothetical protein THASP1DRAFT_29771 [Thamnocephalis sphaerospora]|uniref:S-adenosyl-L-methionine-dependent methyltransferase n=1 Tax=Thamnocephalis sphaerospora TaxID=78915 RepID=A0A4P9XQS6_9FUNG|nr:hypothetical protein THASP1DRAFT_29771 [Thamnocephalis sphaerospora]|eukprot:RKP08413.1 hypothetical protein THASP1DRAFT_29771 [Thamnocephalis sphaerospora]
MGKPLSRPSLSPFKTGDVAAARQAKRTNSTASSEGTHSLGSRKRRGNAFMRIVTRRGSREHEEVVELGAPLEYVPVTDPQISYHNVTSAVVGTACAAPIDMPKRVLDVGVSCPHWMLELADELPESEIIGIDSQPMPRDTVLPGNCTFQIVSLRQNPHLPFPDSHFDYIRHRLLNVEIPVLVRQQYMNECVRATASGGWVEFCQFVGAPDQTGEFVTTWQTLFDTASRERLVPTYRMAHISEMMAMAGLTDIQSQEFRLPAGDWAGPVGMFAWNCMRGGTIEMAPRVARVCEIPEETIYELLPPLLQELNRTQGYISIMVYTGRKVY